MKRVYRIVEENNLEIKLKEPEEKILKLKLRIKKLNIKIKELSVSCFHDNLTGLYNRKFFNEELKRLDAARQMPLSILLIDLNGLKLINDALGYENGNKVLIETAMILKLNCLRMEDIIARTGSDEFMILLPKTDGGKARIILDRIENHFVSKVFEGMIISIATGMATKNSVDEDIFDVLSEVETNIRNKKILKHKSIYGSMLSSLINTLDAKSHETETHIKRVENLSLKLAKKIKLPKEELDKISIISRLHDIGKIAIGIDILNKPGKLNNKEWEIIKTHPEIGYKIASSNYNITSFSENILYHHERWDGNGYPNNLKGDKIPLIARIIAIADSFDVMTHNRPYCKKKSQKESLCELKRCSGTQFDPYLIEEFSEIMRTKINIKH